MSADVELTPEQVTYQRKILTVHTTDPQTGVCPVCKVARCPDWLAAFDTLAAAGQVMSDEPPPWKPFRAGREPGT